MKLSRVNAEFRQLLSPNQNAKPFNQRNRLAEIFTELPKLVWKKTVPSWQWVKLSIPLLRLHPPCFQTPTSSGWKDRLLHSHWFPGLPGGPGSRIDISVSMRRSDGQRMSREFPAWNPLSLQGGFRPLPWRKMENLKRINWFFLKWTYALKSGMLKEKCLSNSVGNFAKLISEIMSWHLVLNESWD